MPRHPPCCHPSSNGTQETLASIGTSARCLPPIEPRLGRSTTHAHLMREQFRHARIMVGTRTAAETGATGTKHVRARGGGRAKARGQAREREKYAREGDRKRARERGNERGVQGERAGARETQSDGEGQREGPDYSVNSLHLHLVLHVRLRLLPGASPARGNQTRCSERNASGARAAPSSETAGCCAWRPAASHARTQPHTCSRAPQDATAAAHAGRLAAIGGRHGGRHGGRGAEASARAADAKRRTPPARGRLGRRCLTRTSGYIMAMRASAAFVAFLMMVLGSAILARCYLRAARLPISAGDAPSATAPPLLLPFPAALRLCGRRPVQTDVNRPRP